MKLVKLSGIIFSLYFLLPCMVNAALAEETSKKIIIPAPSQDSVALPEEAGIKRVLPFYTYPFTKFGVSFDDAGKQTYQAGESLNLKGKVAYPSQINAEELEKIKKECNGDPTTSPEFKKETCNSPEIYKFPYFKKTALLAQIWREDENQGQRKEKGDFLVDEFYVFEERTLKEGVAQEFTLKWNIPGGINEGRYYVSFFLNQDKNFSLLGFPVNVFAPYTRFDFSVTRGAEKEDGVIIDKNNVKINGSEYSQVLPIPLVKAKDNKFLFEVPIANLSSQDEQVTVLYELQKWTEENPENLISNSKEEISLRKGEKRNLSFTADFDRVASFSNLKITAVGKKYKSALNIHFAAQDKNGGVLRFLGLGENQKDKLFYPMFCPRNAQWSGTFPGKIRITLTKENGESQVWEKEDTIPAKDAICFVLTEEKMKLKNPGCVEIKGEILNSQNKLVDRKSVSLDCDKSSPGLKNENPADEYQKFNAARNKFILWAVLLIITTGLIIFFIIIRNKNKRTR